jgi:hypothetical protein
MRFLAACPCPICWIKKIFIPGLGTTADEHRRGHVRLDDFNRKRIMALVIKFIFELGRALTGVDVEGLLQPQS